jgi:transposase-like protein
VKKDGRSCSFNQRFRCRGCRQTFTPTTGTPFAGHRWPLPIITMAVRWYFRHRLSAADVRDLLAEREIDVSAHTVLAWAHKFGPLLAGEARRHARAVRSDRSRLAAPRAAR